MKKRIFSCFLSLLLCFSLVSCSAGLESVMPTEEPASSSEEEENIYASKKKTEKKPVAEPISGEFEKNGFCAGFGRYIITPNKGASMGGYGNASVRLSEEVLDDLYVTCIALWDGENTALFFSIDVLSVPVSVWEKICADLESELGVPKENVFLTATHTHSGPSIGLTSDGGSILIPRALKAAKDAIATLDSAEIYLGQTQTVEMSHVRRYLKEDGTPVYRNTLPDNAAYPTYRHETDPDEEMILLRFDRKNQKDIVMINWSCHVTTVGSSTGTEVSADWVGVLREEIEKTEDVYFSFHQGSAGNTTPGTKLKNEKNNSENYKQHGKDLAVFVRDALPTLIRVESGKIRAASSTIQIRYETDLEGFSEEAIAAAGRVKSLYSAGKPTVDVWPQYGFLSAHHAMSIYNRSQLTETENTMNLGVIAIGDIAFAYAPYEMLSTTGLEIKAASPFGKTLVCGYTNGSFGYIPNTDAFPNVQYEVDSCRYVRGTAEEIVSELDRLLDSIK